MRISNPTRNLWYHTIQYQNWFFSRLVLFCQYMVYCRCCDT